MPPHVGARLGCLSSFSCCIHPKRLRCFVATSRAAPIRRSAGTHAHASCVYIWMTSWLARQWMKRSRLEQLGKRWGMASWERKRYFVCNLMRHHVALPCHVGHHLVFSSSFFAAKKVAIRSSFSARSELYFLRRRVWDFTSTTNNIPFFLDPEV